MRKPYNCAAAIFLLIFAVMGCDREINILPVENNTSVQFYQDEREVNQAVTGIYARLGRNGTNVDFPTLYYWLASENRSDMLYLGGGETSAQNDQLDLRKYLITPNSSIVNDIFARLYQVIKESNSVLDRTNEEEYSRYRGEAYFLRGYAYFELVRAFGEVAIVDHTIESQEALELPRATLEEVYGQIISDLQAAAGNLDDYYYGDEAGRVGSIAATALLGKVYLYMGSYPMDAEENYEKAIQTLRPILSEVESRFSPDYGKIFSVDNENKYDIFSIQFSSGNNGGGSSLPGYITSGSSSETPFPEWAFKTYTQQGQDLRVDSLLIKEMIQDNDTIRLNASIDRGYWNSLDRDEGEFIERDIVTKFLVKDNSDAHIKAWNDYPLNFPVIRPSGVFLDYAEALVRTGNTAEAKIYVDKIRKRARISELGDTPQLTDIFEERKREFIGEGKRFFDLVRMGETDFIDHLNVFVDYYHSNTNSNRPGKRDMLLPIPREEMDVRDNWIQNEGY